MTISTRVVMLVLLGVHLTALTTSVFAQQQMCGWTSPNGHHFNLAPLSGGGFQAQDSMGYFDINVCAPSRSSAQCEQANGTCT